MGKAYRSDKKTDIDFEICFYEGILRANPDFAQALMALGDLYTKKGLYEEGLAIDRKLAKLRPDDPYVLYNLACSYSLLNDIDRSFAAMRAAIQSGYDHFDFLARDPDLSSLMKDPRFREYLKEQKTRLTARPV